MRLCRLCGSPVDYPERYCGPMCRLRDWGADLVEKCASWEEIQGECVPKGAAGDRGVNHRNPLDVERGGSRRDLKGYRGHKGGEG